MLLRYPNSQLPRTIANLKLLATTIPQPNSKEYTYTKTKMNTLQNWTKGHCIN